MLYISRIRLVDIRCFPGEVVIDLTQPSGDRPSWTLILGDNGTGKTSLLRAIAMCLCDETGASGLLTELSGHFIHHGCKQAIIEIQLKSDEIPGQLFTITTTFEQTDSTTENVEQRTIPEINFPRMKIFACGYGAAFGTIGSEVYEKYRLIDAVYSLFNYTARLQNPENALFRISREGVDVDELLERINRILMLPRDSTRLDSSGLQVRGPWGDFVPAGAIGDGYAGTIAWICDLFGWSLLATRQKFDTRVQGIVLLDEIENHLHPSWQRGIIGLLASEFPGVQFITTTHAPLVAIGSASLSDERCQLLLLEYAREGVTIRSALKPPRGRRADQVLTSFLFGLATSGDDDTKEQVHRFAALAARTRSPDEQAEFQDLEEKLDQKVGSAETKLEAYIQQAVHEVLSRTPSPETFPEDSVGYEVLRQIRRLLKEQDAP